MKCYFLIPVIAIFFTCPLTSFTSRCRSPPCLVIVIGPALMGCCFGPFSPNVFLIVSIVPSTLIGIELGIKSQWSMYILVKFFINELATAC